MKRSAFARRFGAGIGIVALGVGLSGGVALAGGKGKGATTTGGNLHGSAAFDALVVTFLPTSTPVTVPANCWFPATSFAYMSVSGNAQFHFNSNKNGFWATTTFTGTASVQPIAFNTTGTPMRNTTGTVVVNPTPTKSFASGHLTVWDGVSINKNVVVMHAVLNFKGTQWTGAPVSMNGQFHFTIQDPVFNTTGRLITGRPTAVHGKLSC